MANWKGLTLTGCTRVKLNTYGTIYDAYEYSFNDGVTWTNLALNTWVSVASGNVMCIRIKNAQQTRAANNYVYFSLEGTTYASGNVNSMITPSFEGLTNISAYPYALHCLFYACETLASCPEFPATTLSQYCYWRTFYSCKNITTMIH